MKTGLVLLSIVAALVPLGTAVQDAAAEEIHVQASFYPYYEFTKNVAGSAAAVGQFLPPGVEAHGWEPSISKVQSLQDTDVFVYNGLGIEEYLDRLVESDDLPDITFVRATDGLALISTTGLNEMVQEVIGEYEDGHYTAEEAVEAIEDILDAEEIRDILESYRSGNLTTTEALSYIQGIVGGGHSDHDHGTTEDAEDTDDHGHDHDHGTTEDAEDTDDHGHDHDHGTTEDAEDTDDHGHDHGTTEETDDHATTEEIRGILEEIRDGDTGYEEGLEAIHDLVGSAEEGHDHGHDHDHDHGEFDPHVWLDPVLAKQQVLNIRDALAEVDPDNAETYQDNAAAYAAQLDELHSEYAAALDNCQRDTIVTFHVAFAYLVERYGFASVSVTGISAEGEPSTADIIELVEYVRANDVTHLLAEEIRDTRVIETIAGETGAQVLTLSPIEGISSEEVEAGTTYLDKMRENLTVLETALGCS